MSGIIALLRTDGRPVDRSLLARMCDAMRFRGPDGSSHTSLGAVGLGHALLATTTEAHGERQPASLDGTVWITADARVDGRRELCRALEDAGREVPTDIGDTMLILHAYAAWGDDFLDTVIGDFAFVLWDQARNRLVWARDHLGVKPLFWAQVGAELIIGNTIDAIRLHPDVSDDLDEVAVADLLTVDFPRDREATIFRQIRRVPPASALCWDGDQLTTRSYWQLPVRTPIRYSADRDYIDAFNAVFSDAVRDRMRVSRIAISMSGGIDSTTVAATAVAIAREKAEQPSIKAFTTVYEQLFEDEERHWTELASDHLRLPVHWTIGDHYPLVDLPGENGNARRSADQRKETLFDAQSRAVAAHARVLLTGYGGDPVCRGSSGYYLQEVKALRLRGLASDVASSVRMGLMPPLLLRTLWRRWRRRRAALADYPRWLNPTLEERHGLRARWRRIQSQTPVGWSAARELASPFWASMFESQDPGVTRYPIELRHPFFDLRVVEYMLGVPSIPWQLGKLIPRSAMRGMLPDAVLRRPKAVLGGDPVGAFFHGKGREWWRRQLSVSPEIATFIDIPRFLEVAGSDSAVDPGQLYRVVGVLLALRHLRPAA